MNSVQIEPSTSVITSNNTDRKREYSFEKKNLRSIIKSSMKYIEMDLCRKHLILDLLSDIHRTARKNQGKQANNNDAKKSRKPKKESKPTQEDQSVRLFKIMQEQIRSRLSCCQPGRELEVLHHTLKPDYNTLWLKCMEVKKDLLIAFQRSYPFVRLEVFGSTVMGIAFKGNGYFKTLFEKLHFHFDTLYAFSNSGKMFRKKS